QIQETVRQFEQTLGLVQPIERDSQQLKRALETGKQIIVSTLQKFPFIVDEVGRLPGRKFGVIIDEAHSSQSGETAKSLKQVLAVDSLEQAEETERDVEDMEDRIAREMAVRGRLPNVSFFAYTATPKGKTLELFGTPQPDGSYAPFSLYPMRQAIEEGFILDVLENYTTYASYFRLLKTVEDDPRFDKAQAAAMLKSFVDLHEHTIRRKVEIMVAHFARHVQHRIDGQAKAMIVTRSRLHCVRFKLEVDRYLRERGYDFKALVAFSGTVTDGGKDYTERSINGFPDSRTAHQFKKKPEYRIIVVADKFQTGFDVPLLHTMYVDKKLGGVNAVQTLSRLNRTHPGKEETMVLDFANEAEEIERAFAPYYEKTLLSEGTDPNQLYDLQDQLLDYHIFDLADVQRFAEAYFDPAGTQDQLHAALGPAVERFKAATKEEQADFRSKLKDYVRRYAFLSQVISFVDTDLEKFYQFARFLARKLPISRERLPVEIKQAVDIDSFRLQQTSSGPIKLPRGEGELQPLYETPGGYHTKDEEPLSQIIRELNERFGADFADEDKVRVVVGQLDSSLAKNEALKRSVEVNPPEKARLSFEHFVGDEMQKMIDIHFKFYKKFTDDPDFAQYFLGWLFDRYHRTVLAQNA
ncbi:MAG: type I restriction endonuclease subunit R, partial [Anaerolineae bacterium]